jgi:hypothetical protein
LSDQADTHQRALAINLDRSVYGSFAEIGAGQEVARWFFQVGGAAGTVARTISAYDMAMSDAIYGKSRRYVSRDRLLAMLDREHSLLVGTLGETRGADTRLFAFADTVAARNHAGTNECHGWMGLRFQDRPGAAPSDALLHVNMLEPSSLAQQQALGVLGVNLLHAAHHDCAAPAEFLTSLFAGLSLDRVEVDVAELSGPAFAGFDARAVGLRLVRQGLAGAVVFQPDGALAAPTEVLRRRPVVLERGRFRSEKTVHGPLLRGAGDHLHAELPADAREPLCLFEMTMRPHDGQLPDDDVLLRRIARLNGLGFPVAVTRYAHVWDLNEHLRRYTQEPIRLALGASTLVEILTESATESEIGGAFQALGRLFAQKTRVYVYPMAVATFNERLAGVGLGRDTVGFDPERPVSADGLRFPAPFGHMYAYLLELGWIVSLPPAP